MNVWLENANLSSNSGPNSFAQKLTSALSRRDVRVNVEPHDVSLCFIESFRKDIHSIPTV